MKPILKPAACILVIGIVIFLSCKKEYSCENCRGANKPPIANAGKDTTIILPVDSIMLDGSGSSDPDGSISNYEWTKISGPASFIISNANSVKAQVADLLQGTYQFELKVTDAEGLFSKDTVQVTLDSVLSLCNTKLIPFGTLSIARYGVIAVAVGNKLLFAGGANANTAPYTQWEFLTRVDIYDMSTQTWATAELSEPRGGPVVIKVGNKIFFGGGGVDRLNTGMDIYDAASNSWSKTDLPYPGVITRGTTGAAVGNRIFFAGGSSDESYSTRHTDSVYTYDISTNSWSPLATLLSEKRNPVHVTSIGNKIYFAGGEGVGSNGIYVSNKVDIYNTTTDSWSATTMYEPKVAMTTIAIGNKIFWAGGLNAYNGGNWSHSSLVEMYDATTGSSSHHQLSTSSYWSTAVLKENKILFFGGWASPNKVDVFDLTSQKWSAYTICPDTDISNTGITAAGNKIYVAGGFVNGVLSNQVWRLEF